MARYQTQRTKGARGIRVKDLKYQIGTAYPRPFLKCFECGAEVSANSGDYFMSHPDLVMMCCDQPLRLVTRATVYTKVSNA